jgi:hypothetical protein
VHYGRDMVVGKSQHLDLTMEYSGRTRRIGDLI